MKKCPFCSEFIQDEAVKCRYCGEFLEVQDIPSIVARAKETLNQQEETEDTPDFRKLWLLLIPVIAIFLVIIFANKGQRNAPVSQSSSTHPPSQVEPKSAPSSNLLGFHIVREQDYSYAGNPRMAFRVVLDVQKLPLDYEVKATATEFCRTRIKDWKEVTVFLYLPGMNTEGHAYAIAEYGPSGLKKVVSYPEILLGTRWEDNARARGDAITSVAGQKRAELEAQVGKVQLTTETKKKIYREFINDPLWEKDDGSEKVILQLGDKYTKKYSLTKTQLALICAEGSEKAW